MQVSKHKQVRNKTIEATKILYPKYRIPKLFKNKGPKSQSLLTQIFNFRHEPHLSLKGENFRKQFSSMPNFLSKGFAGENSVQFILFVVGELVTVTVSCTHHLNKLLKFAATFNSENRDKLKWSRRRFFKEMII